MGIRWYSCRIPIGFLCDFYGISMMFLGYFYDVSSGLCVISM